MIWPNTFSNWVVTLDSSALSLYESAKPNRHFRVPNRITVHQTNPQHTIDNVLDNVQQLLEMRHVVVGQVFLQHCWQLRSHRFAPFRLRHRFGRRAARVKPLAQIANGQIGFVGLDERSIDFGAFNCDCENELGFWDCMGQLFSQLRDRASVVQQFPP